MLKAIGISAGVLLAITVLTMLYLLVRHYHHHWKWQNKVNENKMRKAVLDEFDVQYEVDSRGFVRSVPRKKGF